jgi:zinc transport system substrate-binding protein
MRAFQRRLLYATTLCASLGAWAAAAATPLAVMVSIQPQAHFVERVGGERVTVRVLVPPGQNHETYSVTPRQMADLAAARLFFRVGLPFENALLPKLRDSLPNVKIVDTRQGLRLRRSECGHDHHHGEGGGAHAEEHLPVGDAGAGSPLGMDPHIWLSPRLVQVQATTICDALSALDPAGAAAYARNLAAFRGELEALDRRLTERLAPVRGRAFLVYHPAFGYFADDYGLIQKPIEVEGKPPSASQLARIISEAKSAGVKVVFVEPQFSPKAAESVAAAIGGAVVRIDPIAKDYAANLERIAGELAAALAAQAR